MGKRRANTEGSIYRRHSDGRWVASLTLPGGKRRSLYGKTRQEVARKLAAAIRDRDLGVPSAPDRQMVAQFLAKWLDVARPTLELSTFIRYEEYVRLHAVPVIGGVRLSRLTPQHLQDLYSKKLAEGLSPTTIRHLHAVLHRALGQALRWGLVARNVTELVDPPRSVKYEFQPLTAEQAKRLLKAARGDRLEALYLVALTTAMRQGELLGLRCRDVDLDRGALHVRTALKLGRVLGEPKSSAGRRNITLTSLAVDGLRRHHIRQHEERLAAGPVWEDLGLVFSNTVGRPVDVHNLRNRSFPKLVKEAGLPHVRFHDLRHSTASLLLSLDVHPKIVQELLGHSQISITLDTYSHVLPNLQREAMGQLNRLLEA